MKIVSKSPILVPVFLIFLLFSCKKNSPGTSGGGSSTQLLVKSSSGWETLRSIPFSDANALQGGFQAEDLLVSGDNIGVLYGEVYDVFKGLTSSGARKYKAAFSINNRNSTVVNQVFNGLNLADWNKPEYKESMVFFNNSPEARLFATWNSSTQTIPNRISYVEGNEQGNVTVPAYSMYDLCFERQNITRAADGSVLFVKSNPDLPSNGSPFYINYFDAASQTWLASTAPYENGMNLLSTFLPNHPPAITGSWGFISSSGKYRAMLADNGGGITIVQPNLTNRHCDTLAHIQDAALNNTAKNKLVSGIVNGNTFFGLLYNEDKKRLYEYKWTEGSNTLTKVFADIAIDFLPNPMSYSGNWKYFELKPDGTAFYFTPSSSSYPVDIVLKTVNASGLNEAGRIKSGEYDSYEWIVLPRYSNGYYYAVAYIPVLANFNRLPQLDIIRLKE
jgi:hypothetical protein